MVVLEIEKKVDKLLACLDKDIQQIKQNISYLNEMRSMIIKRDEVALGKLLQTVQDTSEVYKDNETDRQSIRKELADFLGCSIGQITLSKVEESLPETSKNKVIEARENLRLLIEELRKEHSSTVMLVSECARFNKLLLKSIFDLGKNESC
jgi:uncharacterized membrane protein YgaE (UPF0421/DUF939 family)